MEPFRRSYYNLTTNRFVLGGVTAGISNDDIELAPLGKVWCSTLNASVDIFAQYLRGGNADFLLSTLNGNDQNNAIVRFGNTTNSNSYGYIAHDAADNTTYISSVNSGVAHTNTVLGFLGGAKIGIGRKPTVSKLEVGNGDIEVSDVGSGYIQKSPNGTRFRIVVSNTGVLTATQL